MSKLLLSFSHSFIFNTAKIRNYYVFVIGNIQSFISQIFGVVRPLGENKEFFSPLGFDIRRNFYHKTPKIKLYSVIALKRDLNEKNLIKSRVTGTLSKFSAWIFETYFRYIFLPSFRYLFSEFSVKACHGFPCWARRTFICHSVFSL